uniref:Peptidase C1A papain C-terminal domain-containing protein n=2 Tax=Meloidogyne TaxID=189290 RepID=A0A6V7V8Y2_MELEN|nr:unnamed protein product [Meloidogyne enterolobii]
MLKILNIFLIILIIKITASLKLSIEETLNKAKTLVEKINLEAKGWDAKLHKRFALMEDKHLKMLGVKLAKTLAPPPPRNESKEENKGEGKHIRRKRQTSCTDNVGFDARNTFQCCAGIIGAIQDQSSCGSCWAVAVSSAFTDRYCISRMKAGNPPAFNDPTARFSAADMLSCATYTSGCNGGDPYNAWLWTYTSGIVTGTDYTWATGCKPYPFPPHGTTMYTTPACTYSCTTAWNKAYSVDKRFSQMVYFLQGQGNVAAIQNEIKANGSVVAVFDLYSDFYYYSSGVYSHTPSATYEGGHAVRVLGWGTQTCSDGTRRDYWLAANQWNTDWGMQGFFKILRGTDECRFESSEISFGTPNIK